MNSRYAASATSAAGLTLIAALAATLGAPVRVLAAPGDLDTTFGNQGRTVLATASAGGDVDLQADGKIVAAFSGGGFHVARYATNGVLDASFGTGGISDEALPLTGASCSSVVVQPDGYIVAAGTEFTGTNHMDFAVARYDPDGHLDPNFGTGGAVTTALGPGVDRGFAAALQDDGRIVVVGDSEVAGSGALALARYESDGTLDATFGTGGIVTTDATPAADLLTDVAIQPDGRIVATGLSQYQSEDTVLVRYEEDGDLDPTFGSGGMVPSPYSSFDEGFAVALQPDGKILVGSSGDFRMAVARYDFSGALDPTFAHDGTAILAALGFLGYVYDLALQPNGTIVAVGSVDNASRDFAVVRLLPNGRIDPTFAGGGAAITDINGLSNAAIAVAVQDDGNIVAVGHAEVSPNDFRLALARYQGVGPCEPGPAPDSDGDFLCDAADPCFNAGGARDFLADPAPSLVLKKVIGDDTPGDDRLKIRATFDSAAPSFATLDPASDGARLVLYRADGGIVADITLPSGTFTGAGSAGWALNASGKRWRYSDKTGSPVNGIVRMDIRDRGASSAGRVAINVLGRRGDYPVGANDLPLTVTVVLGDAAASAAGVCGEGVLAP